MTPLAPRARLLFHLQALSRFFLFWLPFWMFTGAMLSFVWSLLAGVGVGLGGLFISFVLTLWLPSFAFERWGYALHEHELVIQRGVVFRSVTAIPTGRVQHVDLRQGPLEQWLSLARIQVYTASGVGADGVVPGLEVADAEALRDRLVGVRGDDGV